ncbi:HASPIN protein kinase [Cladophialophora psammophila CBS 110553]|uniref:HASPIN protein kinase n=1 Tax=Cladophialophora psammophila CBS 110553 TaxID=1182543 RepID=W9WZ57_9EURO|nr:HASPIN protein kinase [Cladophialophora psammophila CBS 110553]EXJ70330.1 HASPIN protein kinase [Cladophialophora psammophila CBS 110553]
MADFSALSELKNQQRPVRRNDKTYSKKKAQTAERRAMHFDLFGGGRDENDIANKMEKLSIHHDVRETPVRPLPEPTPSFEQRPTEHHPRPRGRRKDASSRKMAVCLYGFIGQLQEIDHHLQNLTPQDLQQLEPLLSLIEQQGVKDFQEFGRSIGKKYLCEKLGEGSYADVFKLQPKDFTEAEDLEKRGGLIVKIIPFKLTPETQNDIADMESITREVRLMQSVDALHGFVRCRGIHIVSGKYPDVLLEAFDAFKATRPVSAAHSNPLKDFSPQQLYAIMEMNDAGKPIYRLKTLSAFQVYDIFWKTAMTLALAEREIEFEHRDMHNGNICFKPLTKDGPIDAAQNLIEDMNKRPEVVLGMSNLQITVIDYTLSRAKLGDGSKSGLIVFDPMLFWETDSYVAQTEEDKRQWGTYRRAREWAKLVESEVEENARLDGLEYEARNKYERFLPKSNLFWLGYLLADMLRRTPAGRGASLPGSSRAAKNLQLELWATLAEVSTYLNNVQPTLLPVGADGLVTAAVVRGWLAPADMAAFKAQMEE